MYQVQCRRLVLPVQPTTGQHITIVIESVEEQSRTYQEIAPFSPTVFKEHNSLPLDK